MYDEVDEDQYKSIVKGRLQRDDFIVDDNGEGYADDGREEWDGEHPGYRYAESESEGEERPGKGKAGEQLIIAVLNVFTNVLTHASETETRGG